MFESYNYVSNKMVNCTSGNSVITFELGEYTLDTLKNDMFAIYLHLNK